MARVTRKRKNQIREIAINWESDLDKMEERDPKAWMKTLPLRAAVRMLKELTEE